MIGYVRMEEQYTTDLFTEPLDMKILFKDAKVVPGRSVV